MARAPMYDVAIVGLGPVGAVAAALLGQSGVLVYACDRLNEVYEYPRALALDHEVMRVFQQVGLVGSIAGHVEPFTPSEYYGVDGQLIRRMTMLDPPYPQGYTPSLVFAQPPVERALRQRLSQLPSVRVQLGHELIGLSQSASSVELELRADNGQSERIRARWVIGCDGASSRVRELLGIGLEDLSFDEPWLVADVQVHAHALAKLPRVSAQYCEPARPCSYLIGAGNHRRWEISLLPGEDPLEMATPERTWPVLSRWLTPEDGVLWRAASYRFHALVAKRWRRQRVFLAGDAAHMQPPFLGQGLCQGIRDVANLVWKLRAVLRAEVSRDTAEWLLHTYSIERSTHVRQLIERIISVGEVICEREPTAARERDVRMLAEQGGVVKSMPRQHVLPRIERGLIGGELCSARGTLFPQPRLTLVGGDSVLMDLQFGYGWRLVMDSTLPLPGASNRLTIVPIGARGFFETDGVVSDWMRQNECHAALVRPDHYVYGVAETQHQLSRLLAQWQGTLREQRS